ncbi:MAG: porin [Sphingobacteriales bacterium]|nr:porin [Sphingobacteriales bacterium]MBI3717097.1 porin [Sphingobacteriales bacterium]
MLKKFLATFVAVSGYLFSVAQTNTSTDTPKPADAAVEAAPEKKPALAISGSIDAYYKYDFNKQATNNKTSFTNSHNSFELGSARVKLEHATDKLGMVAELSFGQRAEEFNYNDDKTRAAIRQLYISYSPWKNIKFTAGNWATHFNVEIYETDANRNYSMSYMFTYGPFFHTGLKGEATLGKHGFMLGVANPNDYKVAPVGSKKYVIAQYSYSPNDKFKSYINYFSGQRPTDSAKVSQLEAMLILKFNYKFNITYCGSIAFNKLKQDGKYGTSQNWWGSGLYFNYDPTNLFGLTLRTEYFGDKKAQNVFAGFQNGGNVFETTLSANFRVDNLTIIPEFRLENASEEIYTKSSGAGTKSNGNFLVAVVYKF